MKKLICILAVLGGAVSASQDVLETELTGPGWKFWNSTNPEIQLPATTPSTFHLDLLANKVVPDPYYRDNLLQFYRFEYENWTYSYPAFTLDDSFYGKQAIEMTFEGLDTHSDIWLNGKLLASTNNTHRTWVFDVTTKLSGKGQPNNLTIYFNSAVAHDLRAEAAMKAKYDISLPANYSYSRKSAYHYGWDWGPRLVTAGIWRPIKVRAYDYLRINSVLFRNDEVTKDTSKKSVRIYGTVSLQTLSKPAPQG
jgi:beta-mannosidase